MWTPDTLDMAFCVAFRTDLVVGFFTDAWAAIGVTASDEGDAEGEGDELETAAGRKGHGHKPTVDWDARYVHVAVDSALQRHFV